MIISSFALVLLFSSQSPATCPNVEVCQAQALIAHAAKDYEAFHDYAWAAFRKGKSNDPQLMLLVARAQSLSGRPGDAMVMLERVAALGKLPAEVSTDADFERVRALPRWSELESRVTSGSEPATERAAAEKAPAPPPVAKKETTASPKPPSPPAAPKAEPSTTPPVTTEPAKTPPAPLPEKKETPPGGTTSAKPSAETPAKSNAPARTPGTPLSFSTTLRPTSLAYDRVSKRYIIGDRQARRIAVVDENTGQVSTLVGALGALGDVEGIAIDARQGDLWVITSGDAGLSLSKMQLISGRVLSTTKIQDLSAAIVAVTFVPGSGLVVADSAATLWAVKPSGRSEKLVALEYVPKALASDTRGRLYVSAGGPRLARFGFGPFRRLGIVEMEGGSTPEAPFVVVADRLESVTAVPNGFEIRSVAIK